MALSASQSWFFQHFFNDSDHSFEKTSTTPSPPITASASDADKRRVSRDPRRSEAHDDDLYRGSSWKLADLELVNGNGSLDAAVAHADDVGGDVAGLGAVVGHVDQSESQALVQAQ
jgi:hypothetical protein